MDRPVRKAVIPAAGLGTRFLPATKAQPKEMVPLVDKPAIQYVVEEAVSVGITDILVVTGRGKRSIEDHFDRSVELEHLLEKSGKLADLEQMKAIASMAEIHYVRQGEPLGLGHAVSMARAHVGDEAFAVMLPDDLMHARSGVLAEMIAAHGRTGHSVLALKAVAKDDVSLYGCVVAEPAGDSLVEILDIVEKPSPLEAPSDLAVMGRYVLTPGIFDAIDATAPGRGSEIQLTDAIRKLMDSEPVFGYCFVEGRFDVGNKLDYLKATVEFALEREDLGPEFREFLEQRIGAAVIPLEEAQREVLAACRPLDPEQVPVAEALGLVLAEPVSSPEAVPPFRNTAMDGFAVRAADTSAASGESPARLRVIGTLAAGHAPTVEVGRGQALRIMTGAPFPDGADSVAIVETTEPDGDDVLIRVPAVLGEHIRPAGSDIQEGQDLFPAGVVLGPGHLGVLCSVGRATVAATRPPVVGVMSTGDELKEVTEKLSPGEIRDSNRRTLISLLQRDGYEVVDLGIARDVEADIQRVLSDGVERCDAVLTSGGVSMGDFDFVKSVLDRMGKMSWMQVAIRPAKPFAFGLVGDTPVFGLPGNPVSSMVSYEVLARPGLRRMAGHADRDLHRQPVEATVEDAGWRGGGDGRTSFVRVKARFVEGGRLAVSSAGGQGSHQLHAMALADSLAITPPGVQISRGDAVQVLLLGP